MNGTICFKTFRLGGVVVNVLVTGPKGYGFKPGRGDGFLRATKIRSTSFFGCEIKPEAPFRKILWYVKKSLASVNEMQPR
jgi:hypothetical protein